ncbi:BQ2448_6939 [Microbotryum intermedium]|uniref:BQ2448_6939 protein n=1 Tax=Microbotryum intermedium TaxID=269621 RepID=A0A238FMC3_9BASI|nr:BQ2448_6939 [Microbotryum intermedium]
MTRIENLPKHNAQYGTQAYWDERYSKEAEDASFDWFQTIDLVPLVQRFVPDTKARICMLGCGNSLLSANLYDKGYHSIVNLDYSPVLIKKMEKINSSTRPEMTWQIADVRALPFDAESFDVCIDKGVSELMCHAIRIHRNFKLKVLHLDSIGTMDAMMTSIKDPWNPPDQVIQDCNDEIDQVVRVLKKPNGLFLYLHVPHLRLEKPIPRTKQYLLREGWELEIVELGHGFCYYLYILRRKNRDDKTKGP